MADRAVSFMLVDAITGDTRAEKGTVDDTLARVGYICEQLGVSPTQPLDEIRYCLAPLKGGGGG